mgnify:CR=1 FL=1
MNAVNARVRSSWRLHSGHALHVGGRDEQQDSAGVFPEPEARSCLVVLADGMGGHRGGALASSTAIETMAQLWKERGWQPADAAAFLEEGARRADEAVIEAGRSKGLEPRTTIVALVVIDGMAYWMHVGDSRLYCFRDGELLYRTRDHSLLEAMVKAGEIAPEDVATHPDQNVLLRSIGSAEEDTLSVTHNDLAVRQGDSFLLCSDGFWEVMSEAEMATALAAPDLQGSLNAWVNTAAQRQGKGGDNVSAAGLRVEREITDEPRLLGRGALACVLAGLAIVGACATAYWGDWWSMDGESGADSGMLEYEQQSSERGKAAAQDGAGASGSENAPDAGQDEGEDQEKSPDEAAAQDGAGASGPDNAPDAGQDEGEGEGESPDGAAAQERASVSSPDDSVDQTQNDRTSE